MNLTLVRETTDFPRVRGIDVTAVSVQSGRL